MRKGHTPIIKPNKGKTEKMEGSLNRKGDKIEFVDVRFER